MIITGIVKRSIPILGSKSLNEKQTLTNINKIMKKNILTFYQHIYLYTGHDYKIVK